MIRKIMSASLLLLLICSFTAQAQDSSEEEGVMAYEKVIYASNGLWTKSKKEASIKGSPYLFSKWNSPAVMEMTGGKKYKVRRANYNVKLDRMETKITEDSIFAFNPRNIKLISINRKKFKRFLDPEYKRNSFYEVVGSYGDTQVLKRYNITVKEGILNPLTQELQTPDKYLLKKEYFLKKGHDDLKKIKLKKKNVLNFFEDKREDMIKFVKEHKLSYKDDTDISRMITFYNTL